VYRWTFPSRNRGKRRLGLSQKMKAVAQLPFLTKASEASQTQPMAHIYMTFDFGTDEEKAQQARHKLEMWKQAFRLDKKLLYKFERDPGQGAASEQVLDNGEKPAKAAKSGKAEKSTKSKAKADVDKSATPPNGSVKLYLRFAFSGHEKMTEQRMLKKIPSEQPFKGLSAETVKEGESAFGDLEAKFDSLE
jgi:hypothetical protein